MGSTIGTKITYGPGMVHDLSFLPANHAVIGPGDIVDAQGIQLEEIETVQRKFHHPLFDITPTNSYHAQLSVNDADHPFLFTIEGLGDYASLQLTLTIDPHTIVTIVERISGKKVTVAKIFLHIGEGAQVTYRREYSLPVPNHTAIFREAVIQKHAAITWYDVVQKEEECTYETITRLVGEGAVAKTYGVILGTRTQLLDTSHHTIHESPRTTSHTDIRVLLDKQARHIGRTKTTIMSHAHDTSAREEMHTILLSEKAKSQTVPDLDIQENAVQCTHAVTTSRLSSEKLFYLSSRGMDDIQAKVIALEAHIAPSVQVPEEGSNLITHFLAYE